ncbi:hypothetical protein [Nocardia neocaledoniensis]|uniref:hypothetical protein n=1 Tax=Nocardia neocaledoniensis TaxID=236511 RepID=UPI00245846BE|nr:hypothetical protein [Nocardia neocaledoniensis]
MTTTWADVSHHQAVPIDDTYPHRIFAFRTNSGDAEDRLALENARRARAMLDDGRLAAVFPYYFYRPGQLNCDLHRDLLTEAGLWLHPHTATMVDVEDAGGLTRGDQSTEVNDEVARLRHWYGDPRRVFGYLNAVANADLWTVRPTGLKFVTPSYSHTPGQWASTPPPAWMQTAAFAQQYTDRGRCAPWPAGVDLNVSPLDITEVLELLGINDQGGNPVSDPVTTGAGQLAPFPDKIRQIRHPEHVNSSTASPAEAWPYDMWADIWNEVVWDGFQLPAAVDDEPKSLVGWVLEIAANTRAILAKLDQLGAR